MNNVLPMKLQEQKKNTIDWQAHEFYIKKKKKKQIDGHSSDN